MQCITICDNLEHIEFSISRWDGSNQLLTPKHDTKVFLTIVQQPSIVLSYTTHESSKKVGQVIDEQFDISKSRLESGNIVVDLHFAS